METFHNNSKVQFFSGENLGQLQNEINEFMLTAKKIYNVKHIISPINISSKCYADYHYIMVSYE